MDYRVASNTETNALRISRTIFSDGEVMRELGTEVNIQNVHA